MLLDAPGCGHGLSEPISSLCRAMAGSVTVLMAVATSAAVREPFHRVLNSALAAAIQSPQVVSLGKGTMPSKPSVATFLLCGGLLGSSHTGEVTTERRMGAKPAPAMADTVSLLRRNW